MDLHLKMADDKKALPAKKTPGIKTPKGVEDSPFTAPEGFWIRCESCHAILQKSVVSENLSVCTECAHHFRVTGRERIHLTVDAGSFQELDTDIATLDVLKFFDSKSYADRLEASIKKTKQREAFVSGEAKVRGMPVQIGSFEFSFMGGSMGGVVGEKVARMFDRARTHRTPAIIFHASGGARMQEGIISLMQMAKTTAALSEMKKAGLPYVSVLTDPTTGGVAASFAMLGDLNIAEPGALIGFAGPRVIAQTINQKLPEGFQSSEFLLEHGMIDSIVPRREIPSYLFKVLSILGF